MTGYLKNTNFTIGVAIIALLLAVALTSLFYLPNNPNATNPEARFAVPSARFPLGTDNLGRDTLSRVMAAAPAAFEIGALSVVIGGLAGLFFGAAAGYFGGFADMALMKLVDVKMAFPTILLALTLVSVYGPGLANTAAALGIIGIPRFARMARGAFLEAKALDYVRAARVRGASHWRIMFVHILPNALPALVVTAAFSFSGAVLAESGLSYLGLGITPPDASWGRMLKEAQVYFAKAPLTVIAPGIAITLLVLGFNMLGDGVNEVNNAA